LDPTRHLLIHPAYDQHPDGSLAARPIPLDEAAAEWRALVESGRAKEPSVKNQPPSGVVIISPGRASVIVELVAELSKRLEPGLAVGPIQSDGSISRLAKELAEDLHHRAWA
jgi:hypothetical protein